MPSTNPDGRCSSTVRRSASNIIRRSAGTSATYCSTVVASLCMHRPSHRVAADYARMPLAARLRAVPSARQFGRSATGAGRAFGHADERPYRRLTGDWIRVVVAALLLWVSAAHADTPWKAEQSLADFFGSLSSELRSVFEALARLGSLWALAIVAIAALAARRWRLAAELALAGALAWFVGRVIGFLVAGDDLGAALGHVFDGHDVAYPAVPVAVIAAVILA